MKKLLLALGMVASVNAFASGQYTGWKVSLLSDQVSPARDFSFKVISHTGGFGANFSAKAQEMSNGSLYTSSVLADDYGNEGTAHVQIIDKVPGGLNQVVADLWLEQRDYNNGRPSDFGNNNASQCVHLDAGRVNSWICQKTVFNSSYNYWTGANYDTQVYPQYKDVYSFGANTGANGNMRYGQVYVYLAVASTSN